VKTGEKLPPVKTRNGLSNLKNIIWKKKLF